MAVIDPTRVFELNGKQYLRWDALIPYEWEPGSNVFIAVSPPGMGIAEIPALVKGDRGFTPTLQSEIELTELAHNDSTPASATFEVVSPGTSSTPAVYKLLLSLHGGEPGVSGTFDILDADDFAGTPVAKKMLVVNDAANGVTVATQKTGDMKWPTITSAAPGSSGTVTLATIPIASNAYDFAWRPHVSAGCRIIGSGSDLRVDLVARLNGIGGTVIGRDYGVDGDSDKLTLINGCDAGASVSANKVSANAAATIYINVEQQTGVDTYQTDAERISVTIVPVA